MKRYAIITVTLWLCTVTASAQFHTVTQDRANKKPVPRLEQADTIMPPHKRTEPTDRPIITACPLRHVRVTSSYGLRTDPFTGKKSFHNGIDLRANHEPVYAMLAGEVVKVGKDGRSGIYVTLRHGGLTVSYCHLSEATVRQNQVVGPGDVIGVSGSTGRSTGPHLHLTLKKDGRYVNPAILLDVILKLHGTKP